MKTKQYKTIVYSAVVADLFHYGIMQSLKFANSQGDFLICGILTDDAAKYYKKNILVPLKERKEVIENLKFVDRVMVQESQDPTENLIKIHNEFKNSRIILVHGNDWRIIPGTQYVESIGGKVISHPYYTNLSDYKILSGMLERYKGKFKNFQDFINHFNLKDFTDFNQRKIENKSFTSKADTLRILQQKLKKSEIKKMFVFTVLDWRDDKEEIIAQIKRKFPKTKIVARSSAINEDGSGSSMAGCFHSELNIDSLDDEKIAYAINKVIESYNKKQSYFMINQILVQEQAEEIIMSGVAFTRGLEKGQPYYIINYDDKTGSTESVTKGIEGKTIKISRYIGENKKLLPNKILLLLGSIKEIESLFDGVWVDIEFGVNKKNEVIIFQVRPIASISHQVEDVKVKQRAQDLKKQFSALSKKKKHLSGSANCFGDMPDWNPAEIIGDNPNHLDFSLYGCLITDKVWHIARASQGYKNVNPAKLMVLFGNKPYINVRNTFNSFIPASLSGKIGDKMFKFYLNKLKNNPELQDKVEFEILFTCYDLSFDKKSGELLKSGFTNEEILEIKNSLLKLTNDLLRNYKETIEKDMKSVFSMTDFRKSIISSCKNDDPQSLLESARNLIKNCVEKGTIQFSRLARLAFIGKAILKSIVAENFISRDSYDNFMNSISTVAKKMSLDFDSLISGDIPIEKFLFLYGHLRPGTYDITSMRYDKNPDLLSSKTSIKHQKINQNFYIEASTYNNISGELKSHGIDLNAQELFDFIRLAIEARELSKFEFTKSLSDAIELIAMAGDILGFSRQDIAQLDVRALFDCIGKNRQDTINIWKKTISRRMSERKINDMLFLPPIIFSERDFDIVTHYESRPNFITNKCVEGEIAEISDIAIENKIVMLENGDPGYDWIFTKNIKGLITKYGGVASHMSIRCAEFGIPAAIGCGQTYEKLKSSRKIVLDCHFKKIIMI